MILVMPSLSINVTIIPSYDNESGLLAKLASMKTVRRRESGSCGTNRMPSLRVSMIVYKVLFKALNSAGPGERCWAATANAKERSGRYVEAIYAPRVR